MELQSVWSGVILASFTGHHAVHIVAYVTIVLRWVTYFAVRVFFYCDSDLYEQAPRS